jgi:hypothetical protein
MQKEAALVDVMKKKSRDDLVRFALFIIQIILDIKQETFSILKPENFDKL